MSKDSKPQRLIEVQHYPRDRGFVAVGLHTDDTLTDQIRSCEYDWRGETLCNSLSGEPLDDIPDYFDNAKFFILVDEETSDESGHRYGDFASAFLDSSYDNLTRKQYSCGVVAAQKLREFYSAAGYRLINKELLTKHGAFSQSHEDDGWVSNGRVRVNYETGETHVVEPHNNQRSVFVGYASTLGELNRISRFLEDLKQQ